MKLKFKIILIAFVWISILFVVPIWKEYDFYYYHVWECLQAHAHNMSFCVCSEFWKEPDPSDLENPCIIHPSEDPYEHIAHGSNLGTSIATFGMIGFLLTDTLVDPPDPSVIDNAPSYAKADSFMFYSFQIILLLAIGVFFTLGIIFLPKGEDEKCPPQ